MHSLHTIRARLSNVKKRWLAFRNNKLHTYDVHSCLGKATATLVTS